MLPQDTGVGGGAVLLVLVRLVGPAKGANQDPVPGPQVVRVSQEETGLIVGHAPQEAPGNLDPQGLGA